MPDPADRAPLLPRRYAWPAAAMLVLLTAASWGRWLYRPGRSVTELFFRRQDFWVAIATIGLLLAMSFVRLRPRDPAEPAARPGWLLPALAFAVAAAAYAGAKLVFHGYTLSADETMARFDAAILAHGRLEAPVAAAWRPFEPAMAPSFLAPIAGGLAWSSNYLPVNAAIQALFARLGDADLAAPALLAIALVATFGVARRLWPDRPERAWIAVLLEASSAQVLVTAMTPYAMTAHLAFDMAWLWLFLGRSRGSQVAAAAVAFLATGLHQLLFHPLFAAPFVLNLWLSRRWGRAAFHTLAYAAIGLFWASWPTLAAHASGVALRAHAGGALNTLLKLLKTFDPWGAFLMAENALRFLTWSNPLMLPLWLAGAWAAVRMRGVERALVLSPLLTLSVMLVLLPYQGHGWGYRYLHGQVGAIALIAALGFTATLDRFAPARRRALWIGWGIGLAVAVLALLPLRIWQADRFAAPYARAYALMRRAPADAVVLDSSGLFYAWDLVRNDPFLQRRPRMFALELLDSDDLEVLCAQGRVAVFDARDLAPLGVPRLRLFAGEHAHDVEARRALADLRCGVRPDAGFTAAAAPR